MIGAFPCQPFYHGPVSGDADVLVDVHRVEERPHNRVIVVGRKVLARDRDLDFAGHLFQAYTVCWIEGLVTHPQLERTRLVAAQPVHDPGQADVTILAHPGLDGNVLSVQLIPQDQVLTRHTLGDRYLCFHRTVQALVLSCVHGQLCQFHSFPPTLFWNRAVCSHRDPYRSSSIAIDFISRSRLPRHHPPNEISLSPFRADS